MRSSCRKEGSNSSGRKRKSSVMARKRFRAALKLGEKQEEEKEQKQEWEKEYLKEQKLRSEYE